MSGRCRHEGRRRRSRVTAWAGERFVTLTAVPGCVPVTLSVTRTNRVEKSVRCGHVVSDAGAQSSRRCRWQNPTRTGLHTCTHMHAHTHIHMHVRLDRFLQLQHPASRSCGRIQGSRGPSLSFSASPGSALLSGAGVHLRRPPHPREVAKRPPGPGSARPRVAMPEGHARPPQPRQCAAGNLTRLAVPHAAPELAGGAGASAWGGRARGPCGDGGPSLQCPCRWGTESRARAGTAGGRRPGSGPKARRPRRPQTPPGVGPGRPEAHGGTEPARVASGGPRGQRRRGGRAGRGRDGGGLHPPARPGPLAARGGAPPFRADGTPPSAPALSAYPPARRGGLRGLAPAVSDSARSLHVTPRESRSRVPCSDCSSKSVRGRADSCDGGVGSRENPA